MLKTDLHTLVIEMLTFRPTTTSSHIARYITAKTQREVSIADVNVTLEHLTQLGYVSVGRTRSTSRDGTLTVVARVLPAS